MKKVTIIQIIIQTTETFSFESIPGETYNSAYRTNENIKDVTSYVCKSGELHRLGNVATAHDQCKLHTDQIAYNSCIVTTTPFYYTETKKVDSCAAICDTYPHDVKCR